MLSFKIFTSKLAVLTLLSLCSVKGQNLRFALKGGVNVSDFSVRTNALDQALRSLWKPVLLSHFGGVVEKPINNRLSIQGELLYAINGSNLQVVKSYAHFLSIPFILNVGLGKRFVFEVGPQASFIYKSKKSILLIDTDVDFAAVAGGRVHISPKFDVGLRFVQGLAPLGNLVILADNGGVRNVHDFYSRNLQLSLVYQFSKK